MIRRPRFVVTDGVDWAAIWPCGAWRDSLATVGGALESGAGVLAGYVVRRDYLLTIPLRVDEAELATFFALMRLAHAGAAVTWYPDADEGTSFAVRILSPNAADGVRPEPDPDAPHTFTVDVTIRRDDGAAFALDWWAGL